MYCSLTTATKSDILSSYIQDMTPLCALALATSSSKDQTCVLRDFLQRHVSRSVGLGVFLVSLYLVTGQSPAANEYLSPYMAMH